MPVAKKKSHVRQKPLKPGEQPRKSPTEVTEAHIAEICERLEGGETLTAILRSDHMPNTRSTIFRACERVPEWDTRIARARQMGMEALIDSTREIGDAATPIDVHVAKLRVWQRLEEAKRINPERYGDSTTVRGDAKAPIAVEIDREGLIAKILGVRAEAKSDDPA